MIDVNLPRDEALANGSMSKPAALFQAQPKAVLKPPSKPAAIKPAADAMSPAERRQAAAIARKSNESNAALEKMTSSFASRSNHADPNLQAALSANTQQVTQFLLFLLLFYNLSLDEFCG